MTRREGFLDGLRVIEMGGTPVEGCGKTLALLGADVIKVEPSSGESTRDLGPFVDDQPDRNSSLHFWHYNQGKQSVALDLERPADTEVFTRLLSEADVFLESTPRGWLESLGFGHDVIRTWHPELITARITAFGDSGPWANFFGTDLIHLALGGVVMNCGYDPRPDGTYDLPPVAPQMMQAYHLSGELLAMSILCAIFERTRSGNGQTLSTSVHRIVSQSTEQDLPNWVFSGLEHRRLTGRHSSPFKGTTTTMTTTKDGRWLLPYRSYVRGGDAEFSAMVEILNRDGLADDLTAPDYLSAEFRARPDRDRHIGEVVARWARSYLYSEDLWLEGQRAGLTWAPVRKPSENLLDEHWRVRGTFFEIDHPEIGRRVLELGSKWVCDQAPWKQGPRAPLLDEHGALWRGSTATTQSSNARRGRMQPRPATSAFALDGIRVIDLGWMLASGGAGRFLAAQGAEVIKVEHRSRLDTMRLYTGIVPAGGRSAREELRRGGQPEGHGEQLEPLRATGLNESGSFMDMHAGKRSLSLNLKLDEGRRILAELLRDADVLIEGFSPGTLERMGFGYERLRKINPRLVYVQQSGMGQRGSYGQMRSFGPTAQAMSGITEMSGFPEPFPPTGIGYSYLDWFGAYNIATAVAAALVRRERMGEGCWIDSSQVEVGINLTGTAVLDYQVNGREWRRNGNRSVNGSAAPQGVYRVRGEDRWIAIACETETQWQSLCAVLDRPAWLSDSRFSDRTARLVAADELDRLIDGATPAWEGAALMQALQSAGVPAGVCQTARDRIDDDPQLRHDGWLAELEQSSIGIWPAREFPVSFSRTPARIGGQLRRHGPDYGEDNDYVLQEILGLSPSDIRVLAEGGVL